MLCYISNCIYCRHQIFCADIYTSITYYSYMYRLFGHRQVHLFTLGCTAQSLYWQSFFLRLALQPLSGPWPTSMKLSVSLGLLDLIHSVGLLGRVICSSQGLTCTQTQKNAHTNTNTKHPCPEWVRIHDPGFRASEDSACLRLLGYRDRLANLYSGCISCCRLDILGCDATTDVLVKMLNLKILSC
jgi:hypothetical protein